MADGGIRLSLEGLEHSHGYLNIQNRKQRTWGNPRSKRNQVTTTPPPPSLTGNLILHAERQAFSLTAGVYTRGIALIDVMLCQCPSASETELCLMCVCRAVSN